MSHYFITDESLTKKIRTIEYTYRGYQIKLQSDNGVFSKERVDFGTNLLLNSIDDLSNVKTLLDVGCGIGTIGICVSKAFNNINSTLIDVNERAVNLAKENIKINHLTNCKALVSDVYNNINESYDVIISNPPIRAGKKIVHKIVTEGIKYLNNFGIAYFVIQKKQGADSFYKVLIETFGNCEVINKKNGYVIFKSIKRA